MRLTLGSQRSQSAADRALNLAHFLLPGDDRSGFIVLSGRRRSMSVRARRLGHCGSQRFRRGSRIDFVFTEGLGGIFLAAEVLVLDPAQHVTVLLLQGRRISVPCNRQLGNLTELQVEARVVRRKLAVRCRCLWNHRRSNWATNLDVVTLRHPGNVDSWSLSRLDPS